MCVCLCAGLHAAKGGDSSSIHSGGPHPLLCPEPPQTQLLPSLTAGISIQGRCSQSRSDAEGTLDRFRLA